MVNKEKSQVILSIETSGRTGSVASGIDDTIESEKKFSSIMKHSSELFTASKEVLNNIKKTPSDVDQLYITNGPGSFTGLRIAVTMAKMMFFANETKIIAVNTNDVIAYNATIFMQEKNCKINRLATILDAKRGQFYTAIYERQSNEWIKITNDFLIKPADFIERYSDNNKPIWISGEGLVYYKDKFEVGNTMFVDEEYWAANAVGVYKIGRKLAKLGYFADPVTLIPSYIRRPEAEENLEKKKTNN